MNLDDLVARIRAAFPELAFAKAALDERGQDHAVVILDDRWVFRFPRSAPYQASFPCELKLLRALRPLVGIATPDYSMVAHDKSFGGYRMIDGRLLTSAAFDAMGPVAQEACVADIAGFLTALHGLPADVARGADGALRTNSGWPQEAVSQFIERRRPVLADTLDAPTLARLDKAYEHYPRVAWRAAAIIHGDLRDGHIFLDRARDRVIGVIDFGDAVFGDPAYDFTFFWGLSDWAAPFALACYRRDIDRPAALERSRWSFVRFASVRLAGAVRRGDRGAAAALDARLRAQLDALDV
jgi:aminoglycoside 2''-phosphotransferase